LALIGLGTWWSDQVRRECDSNAALGVKAARADALRELEEHVARAVQAVRAEAAATEESAAAEAEAEAAAKTEAAVLEATRQCNQRAEAVGVHS
jgi:hypothetical protein